MKNKLINLKNFLIAKYSSLPRSYQNTLPIIAVFILTVGITLITLLALTGANTLKVTKAPNDAPFIYAAYDPGHGFAAFIAEKESNKPSVRATFEGGKYAEFVLAGLSEKINKPHKTGNKISFKDVLPDMDLSYETLENGIKEEIILNVPVNSNQFNFSLTTDGATPKKVTETGFGTTFLDDKGDYLFHFAKPFAVDASGNRTDTAYYLVQETKEPGIFEVSLFVNSDWLNDESRVYPITIDPTIIYNTSTAFATGSFNRSKDTGGGSSPKLETYYQELSVEQHTVGLWHLNESSGNAIDSSLQANTLTASGTTVVTGLLNSARTLNGSSDNFTCTDASCGGTTKLDIGNGNLSVSAWVKTTTATRQFIVSKGAATTQFSYDLETGLSADGKPSFILYTTADTAYMIATGNRTVNDGSWHQLTGVYDGTTISIYVDGQLAGSSVTKGGTQVTDSTGNFYIGARGAAGYWNGTLDEVMVTKKALTAEEVSMNSQRRPYSVYTSPVIDFNSNTSGWNPFTWTALGSTTGNGETLKNATSLIAQWNFNSNAGTAAVAIAGSCGGSCQGTLVNFADTASYDSTPQTGWTLANSRWVYSLMLDGVDDNVTVADNNLLSFGNGTTDTPMSITMWVYPSSFAANQWIINKRLTSSDEYQLVLGTEGKISSSFFSQLGTSAWIGKRGNTPLDLNKWNYIVVTYDGSSTENGIKQYVNGKLDTTVSNSSGSYVAMNNGTSPLVFGKQGWAAGGYFSGMIDSSTIFGRELTADEILSNYNAGNIEFQTRVGSDTTPDDGSWEPWKPVTAETLIESFDSFATSDTTNSSLVSYWPIFASAITDVKSTNNGTGTNTTLVEGRYGNGVGFSGTSYVTVPDANNLDITGNFTIMGWVSRTGGTNGYVISKFGPTGGGGYALLHGNAGEVYCRTDSGVGYTDSYTPQGMVNVNGGWVHVAAVRTGSFCRVFINGVDRTSNANLHTTVAANALPLKFGVDSNNTSPFVGSMDELRVFNAALSAADIQKYMNASMPSMNISTDTATKIEGTGSLKIETGKPSLDGGTVGRWSLDDTGGTGAYIKDSGIFAFHGTPTGTSLSNGVSGKARVFNGTSDYITIPFTSGSKLDIDANPVTMEAWIKTNSVSTAQGIISRGSSGADGYGLRVNTTGKINVGSHGGSNFDGNTSLVPGRWYHVAGVINGNDTRIYINGQLDQTGSVNVIASATNNLYIGADYSAGVTLFFNGSIDEVKVSNTARTSEEIAEDYRLGRDIFVTKTISSTDLSNTSSVPFYVAGDRPGTYISAMFGESAFANYQSDTNTLGLWHFEEKQTIPTFYDYDSFEESPGGPDDWQSRNLSDPQITLSTAYTGKASLHMDVSFGRNFENGAGEPASSSYDTNTYPYMCMAYKIPATTVNNMLIMVNGVWDSITMTQGESPTSYPKVASWNPLVADNTWQYKCINLDAQLDASLGTGTHTIAAVLWHTGGQASPAILGEFWIDDFSIASQPYFPQQGFARDATGLNNNLFAPTNSITATGGNVSAVNGFTTHSFLSSGTFTVTGSSNVEALVVGGGGGGANTGAGGGAGGYLTSNFIPVTSQAYSITVGAGGAGGTTAGGPGAVGGTSLFSVLSATGGGYGPSHGGGNGGNGGSGGGGAIMISGGTPTGGVGSQGNNGGAGFVQASWIGGTGGGGGAGTVGTAGSNVAGSGNGGNGMNNSILGPTGAYAGGGGGGEVSGSFVGAGGGSGAGSAALNAAGTAATANTGSGGGGGSYNAGVYTNGGNGGSGIVAIRYPTLNSPSLSNAIGTVSVPGKIGLGKYFDGTDHIDTGTNFPTMTNNFTVSLWVNPATTQISNADIFGNHAELYAANTGMVLQSISTTNQYYFTWGNGTGYPCWNTGNGITIPANTWSHVAITKSSTAGLTYYLNGAKVATCADNSAVVPSKRNMWIGQGYSQSAVRYFTGSLDEVRFDSVVRTADEIRQAYEVGARSYPITIDFGAKLDIANVIADVNDLSFTVDSTVYGASTKGSNLYQGDKIVVRTTYDGTTYTAQGTVTSINSSTGAVTVSSWDAGSTFPTGGYSVNADVFKWQREYVNLSSSLAGHRNAITQVSLRVSGSDEGHTVWLDDMRSASYLSTQTGSTLDSSTGNQYFQFRMINSSSNYNISPWLTSVTSDFQTLAPNPPTNLAGTPSTTSIQWNFTDNASNEVGVKLYNTTNTLTFTCAVADQSSCTETGLIPNTEYFRKMVAYNANGNSLYTSLVAVSTLAAVPDAPTVTNRTATTVQINPNDPLNAFGTGIAIYLEEGSNCDGTGGYYLAANGSNNGNTPYWTTDSAWGTVTATGLSSEKSYVACVKAINNDLIETAFSPLGTYNAGYVPLSGDFIYTTDTTNTNTFVNRYPDGYNVGRYVIAVDNGGSPNAAKFEVKSGILTINSTDTLATGELDLTGGSIAIAQGAQIKLGQPVWIVDADADGYSSDGKLYVGTQPANGRRKTVAATLATSDCGDGTYSTLNRCATGGTVTTSGNYRIHTFTSNGTFTVVGSQLTSVETLVVGAGGGGSGVNFTGGAGGGGGGGGKVTSNPSFAVTAQAYPITVGAGVFGGTGGSSIFSTITSTGGLAGVDNAGAGGASGNLFNGGTGSGTSGNGCVGANRSGGGGGGAGAVGFNSAAPTAGAGGIGLLSSITGSSLYYGGGGGGGSEASTGAAGGQGGGGTGATGPTQAGTDGTANTGGGGGGGGGRCNIASDAKSTGGSGVVIIRYLYQ